MKIPTRHLPPLAIVSILISASFAEGSAGRIVTGADTGPGGPLVKTFTSRSQTNVASYFAYTPSFNGGVRVAAGDVNGDGAPDLITGTGPGAAHVRVFSGRNQSELFSFLPYGSGFSGGVFVAAGDVNGDGFDDILTGTDAGTTAHVKVFSGSSGAEIRSFFAYPANFFGGVRVAAGDINGDGVADIVTGAGPGGGPHVKVFDGTSLSELRSFFAYSLSFTGGIFVAAGDIFGAKRVDIATATGAGGPPHVKVFNGNSLAEMHSFLPYPPQFTGGVRIAVGDIDGDGASEIHTAPGGGMTPNVRVFDGKSLSDIGNFLAYASDFTNGVFVGSASVKHPRLEISKTAVPQEIQLRWPSGCLCDLQQNTNAAAPAGWTLKSVSLIESGNRVSVNLPASEKVQLFRLKCDPESVRP
jgi:hypothetical protein